MKFTLEDYQQAAVDGLLKHISRSRKEYAEDGDLSAIGLTAPTGAGKTVIATAVLEGLYLGNEKYEADPDLTVLWLTDDKSLNAQTIGKILQASGGKLDANRIRFIADDDAPTLEPGFIYFLHIQAMAKTSTLHAVRPDGSRSDHRTYGPWDMIANTVKKRGSDFLVIWDEAHRGTGTTSSDRNTIAGTIVNGGTTNIGTQQPAAPVVLGISATPDKFKAAMNASGRTMRLVDVPAGDVRQSGLLKDRILLRSLAESQTADATMLTLAVEDLKKADGAWRKHHEETGDRLVEPLLVVQVPTGATTSQLSEILATMESAWPRLSDYAVAHAFGEPHGPLKVGDRTVRYLPPEAISGDDQARAVLFKSALTTGWDCPRAEVLVSFQGKNSYTEIAQLIGRLVRTPLAKRIDDGDERLNEVVAYLPGFKADHVARVVTALTEDENVETDVLVEPEICVPSKAAKEALDLLDTLPSYARRKTDHRSRTAQLMRLAAALAEHTDEKTASKKARQWIVDQMRAADSQREDEIDLKVKDTLALSVATTVVGLGQAITTETTENNSDTVERDLDVYYAKAQRLLPDGAATWYVNDLQDRGHEELEATVRVAAMAALGFRDLIEEQAVALIKKWKQDFAAAVAAKPKHVRSVIEPLWHVGNTPMLPVTVAAPADYRAATQKVINGSAHVIDVYEKHLYEIPAGRPNAGKFPVDTSRSSWEKAVLDRELADPDKTLVGWYRNPSSGQHALAIPYVFGSKHNLMHPDFLFWHKDGDDLVLDIVDPHRHDGTDTAPKWAALAKYANDHADRVRRVFAVIQDAAGVMRALDLTAEGIGEKVAAAGNKDLIEALFRSEGYVY